MKRLRLYAVTDRRYHDIPLYDAVKASIEGGAGTVQLREKNLSYEQMLPLAKEICALCRETNTLFIVNDSIDVAIECDADGVHIGQSDGSVAEARKRLSGKILGVSVQTVSQAVMAEKEGADYLGVGAVFPTGSKDDADAVSLSTLKEIKRAVAVPVVAIGGINLKNISLLKGSGIDGVAVISAIYGQKDIKGAARALLEEAEKL